MMPSARRGTAAILLIAAMTLTAAASAQAQQAPPAAPPAPPPQPMSFFVTSVGLGDGANLGGLAGADRHCQALAQAVGAGNRTWRAYLSQTAAPATGTLPVNARDRIGSGPWYNAKSVIIAANVDELHGDSQRDRNNISEAHRLSTRRARSFPDRATRPTIHDILTGSDSHGRALIGRPDVTTCGNWTSNAVGQRHGRPSRPAGRAQFLVECGAPEQWLQPAEPGEARAAPASSTASPGTDRSRGPRSGRDGSRIRATAPPQDRPPTGS